jgi:hypothetical protein
MVVESRLSTVSSIVGLTVSGIIAFQVQLTPPVYVELSASSSLTLVPHRPGSTRQFNNLLTQS